MNKEELRKLRMNIQLFAEEADNADDKSDATDAGSDDNENITFTDGDAGNESSDASNTSKKDNTKAFSERLKREKLKIEKEFANKKQAEMDQIAISRGFKNWKELETYSQKERLEAMGIQNTDDFNKYVEEIVAKSPIIEEAKRILESQKQKEEQAMITEAISQISAVDPDIKSLDDLIKLENYDEFYGLVEKGYSIPDAYKIVAFDKITARKVDSATENVITNANSKNHMKPISGGKSREISVPQEVLDTYRKNMPHMSEQEIREHYSKFVGGK